ncbi:universal stress protein [bacterium]|nr:MAG: universal stress protein [bacterium]
MPYKKILVALAGKEDESSVYAEALKLADVFGATLSFIHVNDPGAGKAHMMMDSLKRVTDDDIKASIANNNIPAEKVDQVLVLDSANYPKTIAQSSNSFDLLIIGHHNKNSFLAALTDSTDEKVSDMVSCPILLVSI